MRVSIAEVVRAGESDGSSPNARRDGEVDVNIGGDVGINCWPLMSLLSWRQSDLKRLSVHIATRDG